MVRDYGTKNWIDWCPGCGNFGIVSSLYRAFSDMGLDPKNTVLVGGIGCSGKMPHFVDVNGVHTLHGRAIPFATGIKLANPDLNVIVNGGDGDLLGIGAGHLVALGRRNLDILVMLHDNRVYGLTKGQASPTLPENTQTKALSSPNIQGAVKPLQLALTSGFTHVGRSFAMDSDHLTQMIKDGIEHDGAAFLDILQPCVTYNDIHTSDYFKENIERLEEERKNDIDDIPTAFKKSKIGEKIPLGVFYTETEKETFTERFSNRIPNYIKKPPVDQVSKERKKSVLDKKSFESTFGEHFIQTK